MKLIKKLLMLMLVVCFLPINSVFAQNLSVNVSDGMLSGSGAFFDDNAFYLQVNSSVSFDVEIAEGALYRILLKGDFKGNSIYNISVDNKAEENISIYENDYDRVLCYVNLKEGTRKLTFNVAMGSAVITEMEISVVSENEAAEFVEQINKSTKAENIMGTVEDFENTLGLNVVEIQNEIFYPVSAYDRLLFKDYKNINEIISDLLMALFEERENPCVELTENGTKIFDLKQGVLDLCIKKNKSTNETFVAVYDDENRLFYINKFDENTNGDFCDTIDLSRKANADSFYFKLMTWNSIENMMPKEKNDGIEKEIYLSPNGSDSGDGTENAPFATLKRAKEEIKKYNSDMQGDIIVHIASGDYFVEEEEIISKEYSGTNGYKVIFRGVGKTKPVFSGGKEITGFEPWQNGIYKATFDYQNEMRELFVNGTPAVRAKSKWQYTYLDDYDDGDSATKKIVVSSEEFPNISHPEEAELVWEMVWVCQRTPVENVEIIDGKTIVTLANFYQSDQVEGVMVTANKSFYVENALEVLDEPGEFYYSKAEKTVYYYPYENENISELKFITPQTEGLLRVEGSSLTEKAENISFENISFKHGTWFKTNDYPLLAVQAGMASDAEIKISAMLPTAQININYADNIKFEGCTFESMGTDALSFAQGVTNVDIIGNVIKDIGGSAISIGTFSQSDTEISDDRLLCKNFKIANNVIRRTAFEYREMPAIVAYYGNGIMIENNDIADTAYSGISVGWGWNSMSYVNDNSGRFKIKGNKISRVLWSVTDGANLYTLGFLPDSIIEENYFDSNLSPAHLKAPGIYLDEGSKYIHVLNNVVTNCSERWLLINSTWEDMEAEISGNYTDSIQHSNKSGTELGENYTNLAEFPEKAQAIMNNSGVSFEYLHLLDDIELSNKKVECIYHAPCETYYEGILISATSFYEGSVTECGESYVSFNVSNWMKYEVEIPKDGTYTLTGYIAVGGDDETKKVSLAWQFIEIENSMKYPKAPHTGGYGIYEPVILGETELKAGTYNIWIKNIGGGGAHMKKFIFNEK